MFRLMRVGDYAGKNNRAQSTLELALLFVLIAAALITTAIFVKRSIQGRIRTAAEDIGEQYSPALTDSQITIQSDSNIKTTVKAQEEGSIDAASQTVTESTEITTRTGHEEIGEYKDEPFFFD